MLKINKQLNRPDGGKINSGSIITFDPIPRTNDGDVVFSMKHYVSETTLNNSKKPIHKIDEFDYTIKRPTTPDEFASLNNAGAVDLMTGWLVTELESKLGVGTIETI